MSIREKRQSAVKDYLAGKTDVENDRELLKLFLLLSSGKDNSEELCDRLMDEFGGIDNIIGSDIKSISDINGCTKNVSILLSSIYGIMNHILEQKNTGIKYLKTIEQQKLFFSNMLRLRNEEWIILVTLDKNKRIKNTHRIAKGSSNFAVTKTADITKIILNDMPEYVLLAHNHPGGNAGISAQDISFTISICEWLESLDVKLLDHIIVGRIDTSSFIEKGYERYLSQKN